MCEQNSLCNSCTGRPSIIQGYGGRGSLLCLRGEVGRSGSGVNAALLMEFARKLPLNAGGTRAFAWL